MFVQSRRVVALTLALFTSAVAANAQTRLQTVHSFAGAAGDGAFPAGGLALGPGGNLYGTTKGGGAFDKGTIFMMTPAGATTVLHSFGAPDDGALPAASLVLAGDGNFYGTTTEGGTGPYPNGFGTVFRISPAGAYAMLHAFNGSDAPGAFPSRLVLASDGNLYGTTSAGGAFDAGTAFRVTTSGVVTLIRQFVGTTIDGSQPTGGLIDATDGYLYGMTADTVPTLGTGSIFRMTYDGSAARVHVFAGGAGGSNPNGALIQASDGNLYGTTFDGGTSGRGVFFRLTLTGDFTVQSSLAEQEPATRMSDLIQGADGNLYGTDLNGLSASTMVPGVFSLTTAGVLTRLYAFSGDHPGSTSGYAGPSPLVQAADGSFYGVTTYFDGPLGSVYRLAWSPVTGFDADAAADMPLYDPATGTWRILTSSSGHRSSMVIYWGGPDYTPVPADYDGDGRLDVAVYHAASGTWYVLTSSSNFTAVLMKTWGGIGYTPVPADYDHDLKADFAVYRRATGQWSVLQSSTSYSTTMAVTLGGIGNVPVPGDFDGDETADVAVYAPATGNWRLLTSRSGFTALLSKTLGGPGYAPVAGDYDGDRITDFAVYAQATGVWSVLQSSTDFTTSWTQGWGGTGYTPVPGDYDGDGKADLAVYDAAAGEWFVLQSGSNFTTTLRAVWGAPGDTVLTSMPPRPTWTDASRASDYDGDGASDLAVYEPTTGTWSIRDSSTNFTNLRTIVWGGAGDTPVPGDYDGDGRTDAATFNAASGLWSAQLTSGGVLTMIFGGPGDVPLPRDYDGDLVTDLAVYSPTSGQWRLLLSSTGFSTITTASWGGTGWTPLPGDYDGDGKADLALYQPSTGYWRVLLAASNFTTQLAINWGGAGYTPVPADYDGDGKYDFAVCEKATGQWYVLKSGFTYTTAFGLAWGAAIDTPLAADYDGDGISDMVSYDSTTGEWQLLLSSSYFTLPIDRTLGGPGYIVPHTP